MNNNGFLGFVSTLMLGGVSMAVAVVMPRGTKKVPSSPPPRPLKLVVLEDAHSVENVEPPAADAIAPELAVATEAALPVLTLVEPIGTVESAEIEAQPERPVVFASFEALGNADLSAPVEGDEPVLDREAKEEPVAEDVDTVRSAVDDAAGLVQGQGFATVPLIEDVEAEPPEVEPGIHQVPMPSRKRGGLFGGLRSIVGSLTVRKAASVDERAAAIVEAADVSPVATDPALVPTTTESQFDVPPSLSLGVNGTIIEHAGEVSPPAERFAQAGAELAAELERELAEEREREQARLRAEEAARAEQAAQDALAHQRAVELIAAETEARVKAEARAQFWAVRLDPDMDQGDERDRMKLASSLAIPSSWAGKIIVVALDQDPSEKVRARLIGALARGGHRSDPEPFEKAVPRSKIEAVAVLESLRPFVSEAHWIEALIAQLSV